MGFLFLMIHQMLEKNLFIPSLPGGALLFEEIYISLSLPDGPLYPMDLQIKYI